MPLCRGRSLLPQYANVTMKRSVCVFAKRKCNDAKVGLRLRETQMRLCKGRSRSSVSANETVQMLVYVFAERKCNDAKAGVCLC